MTWQPEPEWDYEPAPYVDTPTVEVVYDDPIGTTYGPDGTVYAHVWPDRPPIGFTRSER